MAEVTSIACGHRYEPWSMVCGRTLIGPNRHDETDDGSAYTSWDCPVHGEVFIRSDVGELDLGRIRPAPAPRRSPQPGEPMFDLGDHDDPGAPWWWAPLAAALVMALYGLVVLVAT